MGSMGSMGKKHKTKNRSAQRDSGISKLGMGRIGPMVPIGLMAQKPIMKNSPAQRDSGISKLVSHLCNLRNQRTNLLCAQHDSIMSNFGLGEHCHTEGAENTEKGIFTMLIKNKVRCFMGRLVDESMSKLQNGSAQRYSRMSNLKTETENSLPQRYSKV